jgi:hypothetical protein
MRRAPATHVLAKEDPGLPMRRAVAAPVTDYCSASGAIELAARIKAYWRDNGGHAVEITVERFAAARGVGAFAIRSNLFTGKPL